MIQLRMYGSESHETDGQTCTKQCSKMFNSRTEKLKCPSFFLPERHFKYFAKSIKGGVLIYHPPPKKNEI